MRLNYKYLLIAKNPTSVCEWILIFKSLFLIYKNKGKRYDNKEFFNSVWLTIIVVITISPTR
jgi:hypothetical protein